MYTEENEFDYSDYEENNNSKKPFNLRFLLKIFLVVLCIVLLIFLFFKIKNRNVSKNTIDNSSKRDSALVFNENINAIRDASMKYFLETNNLPTNNKETLSINLKKLVEEKRIYSIKDSNGNVCAYNTSKSTLTKNLNDYLLQVDLICADKRDSVSYYYDLEGNCLTCNGEKYVSNLNELITELENNNSNELTDNSFDESSDTSDKVPVNSNQEGTQVKVCKDFSEWTNNPPQGVDIEQETRTLVRGYKEEVSYSDWSTPTTTPIVGNENVQVQMFDKVESETTTTSWSKETTTKPSSKEGRVITSRTEKIPTTTKKCSGGSTYTKILSSWDNSAYSCKSLGIGKVECTYKTEKTCKNVTTYKTVTYYKYQDTITKDVTKTYYQSRTITKNTIYTDYILESEMPDGYTKLENSEILQYRYREKCDK